MDLLLWRPAAGKPTPQPPTKPCPCWVSQCQAPAGLNCTFSYCLLCWGAGGISVKESNKILLCLYAFVRQLDRLDFYHSYYHSSKISAVALSPLCPQSSHLKKKKKSVSPYLTLQSILIMVQHLLLIQCLWAYSLDSLPLHFYYPLVSTVIFLLFLFLTTPQKQLS